ncbi:tetratricopeptide repeat protein [Candidatus Gracilibacteria bacterium]|nr:tetratricopeptide repeat protein [Candidatus Gracilibacteria bacterium]
MAAYERGDHQAAIAAFELMLADQPFFVDGRTDLARVYLEMGDYEGGWEALGNRQTHRSDVIRGALSREQGDLERARFFFEDAEFRAGEDVQALTLQWLKPDATNALTLGNGLDFGYLQGFSFGEELIETDGSPRSYRWLQGDGSIVLPLTRPLEKGSFVRLRMTGTGPTATPLRITIGGQNTTIQVRSGEWRVYRVPVPEELYGQQQIRMVLARPSLVPVQYNPASTDARLLSLMISNVAVE